MSSEQGIWSVWLNSRQDPLPSQTSIGVVEAAVGNPAVKSGGTTSDQLRRPESINRFRAFLLP